MKNQKSFGIIILVSIIVGTALIVGFVLYQAKHKGSKNSSVDPGALMTVTSSGGMCNGPCDHPAHNLYTDGKFEGYKKLSASEVSKLENIISSTDFLKYRPNPHPQCESFVDGFDRVFLFPQKYGNKTFTTCMLDIRDNDPAFTYINELIKAHYIQ